MKTNLPSPLNAIGQQLRTLNRSSSDPQIHSASYTNQPLSPKGNKGNFELFQTSTQNTIIVGNVFYKEEGKLTVTRLQEILYL